MHETDSWQMIFSSAFLLSAVLCIVGAYRVHSVDVTLLYIVDVIGLIIVEHKNGVTILMHLT